MQILIQQAWMGSVMLLAHGPLFKARFLKSSLGIECAVELGSL